MNSKVSVLDCTLRDGSYAIDYQFNAEDTFLLASALASSGVEYIEIGHGLGLDADKSNEAGESDFRYAEAAIAGADSSDAKVGVFFIPGIGKHESIGVLANEGIKFIRIGANAYEAELVQESVSIAKEYGLEVSVNLMKSYALTPSEFAKQAELAASFGADSVVVVDSAGGMTPQEVSGYFSAVRVTTDVRLGFHGHNNLQLAHANCLAAVEAGASIVDGSLRGMGRSAGNACTEILASLLGREGYNIGSLDIKRLLYLAENVVAPMMQRDTGVAEKAIVSGLSYFHSGYNGIIDRAANAYGVSASEVIYELGERGKREVNDKLAQEVASKLSSVNSNKKPSSKGNMLPWYTDVPDSLESMYDQVTKIAKKLDSIPVITIALTRQKVSFEDIYLTSIRSGYGYSVAHIEVGSSKLTESLISLLSDSDVKVLLSVELLVPDEWKELQDKGYLLRYDDKRIMLSAISDFIQSHQLSSYYIPDSIDKAELSVTENYLSSYAEKVDYEASLGIAISEVNKFSLNDLSKLNEGALLLMTQINSVDNECLSFIQENNVQCHRLDFTNTLLAEVARVCDSKKRLTEESGRLSASGMQFVAGGVVGRKEDVVLNTIKSGARIIGVADGKGGVMPFNSLGKDKMAKALNWVQQNV